MKRYLKEAIRKRRLESAESSTQSSSTDEDAATAKDDENDDEMDAKMPAYNKLEERNLASYYDDFDAGRKGPLANSISVSISSSGGGASGSGSGSGSGGGESDNSGCSFPSVLSCQKTLSTKNSESTNSTFSSDSCMSSSQQRKSARSSDHKRRSSKKTKSEMTEGELQVMRDLKQFTLKERQTINHEVDGTVIGTTAESPAFIESAMQELDAELVKIRSKSAFDFALFISPRYVKNAKFQLMFLRSEKFHIRKAAKRMVAFFDLKMKLFGMDMIAKDVSLSHMTEDDREALYAGGDQLLPNGRDSSGRIILWDCIAFRKYKSPQNHLRMLFFLLMKVLQDDEQTQLKGMIVVGYIVQCPTIDICDMELNQHLATMTKAMPARFGAIHVCFDNPVLNLLLSTVLLAFSKDMRVRYRTHFGSHMEVQYDVTATYGIPNEIVPIDQSGQLKTAKFHQWLAQLADQESVATTVNRSSSSPQARSSPPTEITHRQRPSNGQQGDGNSCGSGTPSMSTYSSLSPPTVAPDNDDFVDVPFLHDVLLGRGRPYREYPGNCKLRELVDGVQKEYDRVSKASKTSLAMRIVMKVKQNGGRFLSRADDENMGWVRVGDEAARTKVAQSFRNNRMKGI